MGKNYDNHTSLRADMEEDINFIAGGKIVASIIIGIFLTAVLFVFPLYYQDFYFDILGAKYKFYYISVFGLLGCLAVLAFILITIDQVQYNGKYRKKTFSDLKKNMTLPDIAIIIFLLIAMISTICSDYVFESFWGNEGRYTGLFLLLLYGCSYFVVSKFFNFKNWFMDIFLVSSLLVGLFGITDFFNMNILHFKDQIDPKQYNIFMSSMGNINTYTAYLSLALGVSSVLFASQKKPWKCVWYYICLVIGLFAIVTGQSDNAYLALMALFGLLPLYMFGSWSGIKRYVVIIASFFSIVQGIDIIMQVLPERVLDIKGIFSVLVGFDGLGYIVIALWFLVGVLYLGEFLLKKDEIIVGAWPRKAWGILIGVLIIVVLFVLFDANFAGNGDRYGALKSYVVIDDEWGTHRGYIWKIGLENYKDFSPIHKIFGYGPDTYGIMTVNNNYDEMISRYNEIFDSAHNEYLQYFVTIGPFGLLAYLTLLFSAIFRMIKKAGDNPYVVAAAFAVVCYGAQAFVNINLPIATPVMWTLLMMGLAGCRGDGVANRNSKEK